MVLPSKNWRVKAARAAANIAKAAIVAGSRYVKSKARMRTNPLFKKKPAFRLAAAGRPALIKGNPTGIATRSGFNLYSKPSKTVAIIKKIGASNAVLDQQTSRLNADAGFQDYDSVAHCNAPFLANILNQLPNGGNTNNTRFVVKNYNSEMLFSNASNMACELEIYDLTVKRDFTYQQSIFDPKNSTNFIWAAGLQGGAPGGALQIGTAMGTGTLASPLVTPADYTFHGAQPADSNLFLQYFTVKKRTLIQLPQGGCHRHNVTLQINKVLNKVLLNNEGAASTSLLGLKGVTVFTMWRIRGYPVSNDTGTNVTTASTGVDMVQSRRWSYTYVLDNSNSLTYADNLTTPALASQHFVNPGSGNLDVIQRIP